MSETQKVTAERAAEDEDELGVTHITHITSWEQARAMIAVHKAREQQK